MQERGSSYMWSNRKKSFTIVRGEIGREEKYEIYL